jgi:septum formation protein
MRLILASASPRRAELLAAAGFEFEMAPADIDETPRPGERPTDYVLRLAREKARVAAEAHDRSRWPVLAADTVVVARGELLGKPGSPDDASRMLAMLSDAVHEVHTGVALLTGAGSTCARPRNARDSAASKDSDGDRSPGGTSVGDYAEVATTRVRFGPMTPKEIAWYVATGEPDGKAGAYAIQGRASRFIEWIDGSWSNVVGLPVATVYRMLRQADMVS